MLEAGKVLRMSVVCGCCLGPEKWRCVCHCESTCAKIPGHNAITSYTHPFPRPARLAACTDPRPGEPGGGAGQGRWLSGLQERGSAGSGGDH